MATAKKKKKKATQQLEAEQKPDPPNGLSLPFMGCGYRPFVSDSHPDCFPRQSVPIRTLTSPLGSSPVSVGSVKEGRDVRLGRRDTFASSLGWS